MKNKLLPSTIIISFIIVFLIFYKGLKETNIYTPKSEINKDIPNFSSEFFFTNKSVNSSEVFNEDKFYLLNIWSSWCVPCRQEHPLLMKLSENDDLILVGLNYKDNKSNAENFLIQLGNPYKKILLDNDGTIAIEWGAFGVPETFLIYRDKIIQKFVGPLNNSLISEIENKLK